MFRPFCFSKKYKKVVTNKKKNLILNKLVNLIQQQTIQVITSIKAVGKYAKLILHVCCKAALSGAASFSALENVRFFNDST